MKLTYWHCPHIDSNSYSVRERTKKAALAAIDEYGREMFDTDRLRKVSIEYDSSLDLVQKCGLEMYWETY